MSKPTDNIAVRALPPDLDPPLVEFETRVAIAFERLSQADDIVAYQLLAEEVQSHVNARAIASAVGSQGQMAAPVQPGDKELALRKQLDALRPLRDLTYTEVYVGEADPSAAFEADIALLHSYSIGFAVHKASMINAHRRAMIEELLAEYENAIDFEEFALAARDYICMRSAVTFDLKYLGEGRFTLSPPVAIVRHVLPMGPGDVEVARNPQPWLNFGEVNSAAERRDGSLGGVTPDDLWELCHEHPILVLLPQLYLHAGLAALALWHDDSNQDLAAIGERFLNEIRSQVFDKLRRLEEISIGAVGSSRGHAFILPAYLDQASRILAAHRPDGERGNKASYLKIAQFCHMKSKPLDWQAVYGFMFGAAAICAGVGAYLIATAASGGTASVLGPAVLALIIDTLAIGMDASYLFEAFRLDDAGSAERLFRALEPKLTAFETDSDFGFDLAMFAFGCILLLPAVAEVRHAVRLARAGAQAVGDGAIAGTRQAVHGAAPPAAIAAPADLGTAQLQKPASHSVEMTPLQHSQVPAADNAGLRTRAKGESPSEAAKRVADERAEKRAEWQRGLAKLEDPPVAPAISETDRAVQELLDAAAKKEFEELFAGARQTDEIVPLAADLGKLDEVLGNPRTTDDFFPGSVRFVEGSLDDLYAGKIWSWVQSTRRGLGRSMTETSEYYGKLLEFLGIDRRVDLRRARGYHDSLRSDVKLHAYWKGKGWAREVTDAQTGAKRWQYKVEDGGSWLERNEIDFGHVVDVVVYDQAVFLVESEIRTMMHARDIPFDEVRMGRIDRALRKLFMDNPMNYIPELKGVNRGNTFGLSYRDSVTFRQAFDMMMGNKNFANALKGEHDAFEVMEMLLDILVADIPESALLRHWRDELRSFTPPVTGQSGAFWPVEETAASR